MTGALGKALPVGHRVLMAEPDVAVKALEPLRIEELLAALCRHAELGHVALQVPIIR